MKIQGGIAHPAHIDEPRLVRAHNYNMLNFLKVAHSSKRTNIDNFFCGITTTHYLPHWKLTCIKRVSIPFHFVNWLLRKNSGKCDKWNRFKIVLLLLKFHSDNFNLPIRIIVLIHLWMLVTEFKDESSPLPPSKATRQPLNTTTDKRRKSECIDVKLRSHVRSCFTTSRLSDRCETSEATPYCPNLVRCTNKELA